MIGGGWGDDRGRVKISDGYIYTGRVKDGKDELERSREQILDTASSPFYTPRSYAIDD